MSDSAFPRAWHVTSGTRGTDVKFSSSLSLSGGASVYFPSTAGATATVGSDWYTIDDINPTGASGLAVSHYTIRAHVRASSVAANKNFSLQVQVAPMDGGPLTTTTTLYNDPLQSADTWESVGGIAVSTAACRKLRVLLQRPNDYDFDLYVDSVEIRKLPPYYQGHDSGGTFPASFTSPTFGSTTYINRMTVSSGVVSIAQPGIYVASGTAMVSSLDSLADGDGLGCRIGVKRTASASYTYFYGSLWASAAHTRPPDSGLSASAVWHIDSATAPAGTYVGPGSATFEVCQYTGTSLDYEQAEFTIARISE